MAQLLVVELELLEVALTFGEAARECLPLQPSARRASRRPPSWPQLPLIVWATRATAVVAGRNGVAQLAQTRIGVVDELRDQLDEEVLLRRLSEEPELVQDHRVDRDLGRRSSRCTRPPFAGHVFPERFTERATSATSASLLTGFAT